VNRFAAVRAGYGAVLLCAPDPVVRLYSGHPADRRTRAVARVLGARHLAQAVATAGTPGRAVLALGVEADLAHAASMIGLAGWDRARARAGSVDAFAAASLALVGVLVARRTPWTPPHPVTGSGALARCAAVREAVAAGAAHWLLPSSLRPPG
jgi:hypothetical protein